MITDRIGQQDALSPIDHNQKVKVSFVIFKYDNYKQENYLEKWLLRLFENIYQRLTLSILQNHQFELVTIENDWLT